MIERSHATGTDYTSPLPSTVTISVVVTLSPHRWRMRYSVQSLRRVHMDGRDGPTNGLVTSRDWTLERLLEFGPRFRTVDRISIDSGTPEQIMSIIKDYEQRCVPLVAQDLHLHPNWPDFFTPQWLETQSGSQGGYIPVFSFQTTSFNLSSQLLRSAMSTAKG